MPYYSIAAERFHTKKLCRWFRFVIIHAFDGRTDGRTDGLTIANTALHTMQRGKNSL